MCFVSYLHQRMLSAIYFHLLGTVLCHQWTKVSTNIMQTMLQLGTSVLCKYAIATYLAYRRVFFAYFSKVCTSHNFPHILALMTAIIILLVFLLPISSRFRYINHLVANRMALSMCPYPCGTRWGSWV